MVSRLCTAACLLLAWTPCASATPDHHIPRLTVSWQPGAGETALPLAGYRLYRACDPQGLEWAWLVDVPLEQHSYQDTALRYGQRCCYKVYARYRDLAPPPAKKGRKKPSPTEPPLTHYRLSPAMPEHCADTPPEPPLPGVEQLEVTP